MAYPLTKRTDSDLAALLASIEEAVISDRLDDVDIIRSAISVARGAGLAVADRLATALAELCEGHADGPEMGVTSYCDGSCRS